MLVCGSSTSVDETGTSEGLEGIVESVAELKSVLTTDVSSAKLLLLNESPLFDDGEG